MQAGDFDVSGDVLPAITRRVYVNGVHRHHVSDSWDAEIGSDLPEQVSGVTGIKARTGSVTFAPQQVVSDSAPTPMQRGGGWPPQRGDVLTITDATATQHWTRATARIVEVRADLGDGLVEVSWSDDLDSALSQTTELPPQAERMPGEEVMESGVLKRHWHRTGLEPWAYVVEGLEDAGMRLLPSIPDVDFYVMFQGTVHPRIGRISQTYSEGDLLAWDSESGFQYLNQWSYFTPGYEGRTEGDCFTIYLRKTRGGPTAQTRWTMADGSEIRVTLVNNSVAVSRNGIVIAQRGFTSESPLPWVGVSIALDRTTLWVEGQPLHTVIHDPRFEPWSALEWERVRVHGAAALAVSYVPLTGWPGFSWPSLRYRGWGESLVRDTTCARSVEPTTVKALLDDIASSTLTGYWLDEHGILQWAPSVRLEQQSPAQAITTRADVLAGSWTETGGGVASEVVVAYEDAALTTSSTVTVTVQEGSGSTKMSAGDVEEEFVGPEANEEWIEPDMSPLPASQNSVTTMRQGRFSIWGGNYVAVEGETEDTSGYGWAQLPNGQDYLRLSVEGLTPRRWKVTHTCRAGSKDVQLQILPGAGTQIPVPWRGMGLPIWRARGRAAFADASVSYRRGPAWAPAYEHSIGAWGSRADAQRVGDYLSTRMSSIQVVLSGLAVIPDPRRQLGDVIEVAAQRSMGGVFRCLVVGIHESSSVEGIEQKLDLRVIRATPEVRKIYADIESTSLPYSGIESGTAPYSDLEA